MRLGKRVQRCGFLALGALLYLGPSSAACNSLQTLLVVPDPIKIGAFFHGAEVSVSAKVPEGCDAVVEVSGKKVEEDLMRKGRRWDLWMNVGEIDIQGAPSLYLVMSTDARLLDTGGGPWGFELLRKRVSFHGKFMKEEVPKLFGEFIRLKQSQALYGTFPGALKLSPFNGVGAIAQGTFRLPVRISPGTYRACLSIVQDGQIVERRCTSFDVVVVGLPAFLSFLASGEEEVSLVKRSRVEHFEDQGTSTSLSSGSLRELCPL
ncbi:MAG: TIGR02186 family protein [Deltaproteobacteria bacterium]